MIADGDRVAVGISGGKDSAALLYIMKLFQKHSPINFDLVAVYVDLGWPSDPAPLHELVEGLGLELYIEKRLLLKWFLKGARRRTPVPFVPTCVAELCTRRLKASAAAGLPWVTILMTPCRR